MKWWEWLVGLLALLLILASALGLTGCVRTVIIPRWPDVTICELDTGGET